MRVTYYDKDGKVTETKDFGDKASDAVLNYDDTKLFFSIFLNNFVFLSNMTMNSILSLNCVTNRMSRCRAILGILAAKILRE